MAVCFIGMVQACTSPTPPPSSAASPDDGQVTANGAEGTARYSQRTLDSTTLRSFLKERSDLQGDTSGIVDFYQRRGWQFAWVVSDSLSAAADAFIALANMTDTTIRTASALRRSVAELYEHGFREGRRIALCDSCATGLEMRLTAAFFQFAEKRYGGYRTGDLRELEWYIPRRKKDVTRLLDRMTSGAADLTGEEPLHPQYHLLKQWLPRYRELAAMAWPELALPASSRKLVPGDTAAVLSSIRRRLFLLGDITVEDEGDRFDSTLVSAVLRFQERHGLTRDTVIGKGFMKAINTPIDQRILSVLVNMERLRWVPEHQAPDLLLVNIPDFKLHVFEGGRQVMEMEVVVGTSATRTVIFSDSLSQIVFSPTWTIPMSIVRNEILPAMAKDPNYLARKNMEIIGGSASAPIIRQKPGPNNSLGRVKFLFPNSHSIYMHDTPAKALFAREKRAFSHGCIRLSRPADLAEYLLRDDPEWSAAEIKAAMLSGKETYVRLKEKRPVSIGYFTAWVDTEGQLHFREDIYGHDARLAAELFEGATVL